MKKLLTYYLNKNNVSRETNKRRDLYVKIKRQFNKN